MESVTSKNTFGFTVKDLKANHNKDDGPMGQQVSAAAREKNDTKNAEKSSETLRQQYNQSILKSSLEVSVSAGNEPLALLYKAAIDGINEVLKDEFGDNAIQNAYDSVLDVSPEATADRIVEMSTAFFSKYQEQNPELSDAEAAKKFSEIIGGGIDKGFAEAREILDGLKVLEGDIASNIDVTHDLVQDGLQAFVDSYTDAKEEL